MNAFSKFAALAVLMMHCSIGTAASGQMSATELLQRFRVTDFSSFLGTTNVVFRQDALGGVIFRRQAGYVAGGTLESVHRRVGVAIYESHEAAIAAVEAWRKDVASVIERGPHERSGTTDWWFGESQAYLAIVQDDVVFIVSDLDRRYSEASEELWATATKFLKVGL